MAYERNDAFPAAEANTATTPTSGGGSIDRGAGPNLVVVGKSLQGLLAKPTPVLATAVGAPVLPLAVGTYHRLAERTVCPRRQLSKLMFAYTNRTSYLRALTRDGAKRHDLDGNEVEPVSTEHQQAARERLKKRLKWKARKRRRAHEKKP